MQLITFVESLIATNMGEKFLITDTFVETVSAIETVSDELMRISIDPYRWKWVILAMHI
jgi:hypothetical protein